MITWIKEWTKSQIDGDWEHELGFRLELTDNPGWLLSVDLVRYEKILIDTTVIVSKNKDRWIHFKVEDSYLYIMGDIEKLSLIFYYFKKIIEKIELLLVENRVLDETLFNKIVGVNDVSDR